MLRYPKLSENQGEFITTQTSHSVLRARDRLEPRRDASKEGISDCMAETVIDRLEPINVEIEHRQESPIALRIGERLLQAVVEELPVWQPGEEVVICQVKQLLVLALRESLHVLVAWPIPTYRP